MNLFVRIVCIMAALIFEQCYTALVPRLGPCPKVYHRILEGQLFSVYVIPHREPKQYLRLYHSEWAFETAKEYAAKLRTYKQQFPNKSTYTEPVLETCETNEMNMFGGIVTLVWDEFRIAEHKLDKSGLRFTEKQKGMTSESVVTDILTAIITYNEAGIVGLQLNEGHLQIFKGHISILTGPLYQGAYCSRIRNYAPEVLTDVDWNCREMDPRSDTWFAGVIYYAMLTKSRMLPYHDAHIYGNLEVQSKKTEYEIDDDERVYEHEQGGQKEYKKRLQWMTYFALRIIGDEPYGGESAEVTAVRERLTKEDEFSPNTLMKTKHRNNVKLEDKSITVANRQFLYRLLRFDPRERPTPVEALQLLNAMPN